MLRTIKLPSLTSGPYTAKNNRIEFELDMGSQYDLTNAYFNVYCNVGTLEKAVDAKEAIHNFQVNYNGEDGHSFRNCDLIKNARMTSSKAGIVEDIRDVHILQSNLKLYTETMDTDLGADYKEVGQLYDRKTQRKENIFREFIKEGDDLSRELTSPIRVHLKDVFSKTLLQSVFDTDKMGRVRFFIEMNLDKVLVEDVLHFPETVGTYDNSVLRECDNLLESEIGSQPNFVTITEPLQRPEDNPYWNGCKVHITATGNGGASNVDGYFIVNEIDIDSDNKLTLVLDDYLGDLTTSQSFSDVVVVEIVDAESYDFNCDYAELVVNEFVTPVKSPDVVNYYSFTTEQFNANGSTNFQRIFQVEPNAVNLMVFMPSANGVLSTQVMDEFRMAIDNHDVTDRYVEPQSPLYYDLINKTMLNANMKLKNLNECELHNNRQTVNDQVSEKLNIQSIMTPLPISQREKQVQVNINASSGVNKMNLYKLVLKELQL